MNVLFVQGAGERAGAERVLLALVRALDHGSFSPSVAFLADGPFVDEVASFGIPVHRLPSARRIRHARSVVPTVRGLTRLIRRSGADVVQASGEKMSFYAGWASRAARRPCVFWLHDAIGRTLPARLAQTAMATAPHAAVVTHAQWMVPAFRKAYRLRAEAIHNGVFLADLPPVGNGAPAALATLKAEAGWPADAVVATFAGRLERWKGPEVFLRAGARAAASVPELRLLVVGGALYGRDAAYAASLPRLAERLGLGKRVTFTGHRSDALDLIAASDIVAHCSIEPEPFSLVVLEALALGRALVATRSKGPEEAIEDGRTGILVPSGDEHALALALETLARSPERRRALGASASAVARDRFSADRMARRFEEVWRRVAR